YSDREAVPDHEADKLPRFDVVAQCEDGRRVHVEVQLERDRNMLPRTLNYTARDYLLCTHEGEDYSSAQVICIVVADFTLFKDTPAYHTLHRILNVEDGAWHMRGMEFHFIEMPKLRKRRGEPVTGLERMLYYLGNIGGETRMRTLAMEDTRVARMAELEGLFRRDPNLLRDYWDREQARRDYNLALRNSRIDGIREGELRGELRGKREGIREGKREGIREGEIKGKIEALSALVHDGLLTLRDAALRANITEEQFAAQMSAAQ
ncbi:MAG: Rpn family recombination-promoting nuclease/putative transposase, partial [Fretibacterium sp.]|nr:Rpn family recombination-promoting nuclease/putative transposase [Fretibacterium sp.]